ncbi:MAG TPA: cytochrome c peroxidase [Albitalea sp.]|nr:cytochrome c peroxidase [Albitalea sp.]
MDDQRFADRRLLNRPVRRVLSWLAASAASTALLGAAFSQASQPSAAADGDRWTSEQRAVLASLQRSALGPAVPDASNRVAASPAAARLGKLLFNDTRFSGNGKVACATCHRPQGQFEDGRPRGLGVAEGQRRTMPVMDLRASAWFFWDGRKDSLWAQALGPLEDAKEHGGNRLRYAHLLQQHYRAAYESLFGPMPDLRRLPADAGPHGNTSEQAAWAALDAPTQRAVSRVFANMGKSIAAYESTLHYGDSRVDRYIDGVLRGKPADLAALSTDEKAGLRLFIGKGQCVTCHSGPLLTDHHFHNTGIPPFDTRQPERGRAAAIAMVKSDEFNCLGPFSDARPEQCEELRFIADKDPHMVGAFKTPSLRNVALRPPYMHAGQIATLPEVLRHYARAPEAAVGHSELRELKPHTLSPAEIEQLVSLLRAFSGPVMEDGVAP